MKKHDILIIGGGASGVMLALLLADHGKDVAILEAKDRILKKLLTTGNGRCNITNELVMENIKDNYSSNNQHYDYKPLHTFTLLDTLNYFKTLGLSFTTLEDHKMYPLSLQSSSVVDILRLSLEEKKVPVYLNQKVKSIQKNSGFQLRTVDETYACEKLIISSGGLAAPGTGSDGSLNKIIRTFGHNIHTPHPALVQLKLDSPFLRALSGVKINGNAMLMQNLLPIRKESGELLFTDYGISGPPILQLSRFLYPYLSDGEDLTLSIDMFPHLSTEEVKDMVLNQTSVFSYRSVIDAFKSILPNKLIPVLLKESGIDKPSVQVDEVEVMKFHRLATLLKSWNFKITGTQGFNMAQGTYGGVDTLELKDTLESKKVKNLYFTGEVIDVLGACGGFNLQWAWSTAGTVLKDLTK